MTHLLIAWAILSAFGTFIAIALLRGGKNHNEESNNDGR